MSFLLCCTANKDNAKIIVLRLIRLLLSIVRFFVIGGLSISAASAQMISPSDADSHPPTFVANKGEAAAVGIEDADTALRARISGIAQARVSVPSPPQPNAITAGIGAGASGLETVGCATGSAQPVEIATLAASLKCDPDLIFEYVYNNIEYEPLFGSNKGPLGALLDQRGNDIDQAQLFVALLEAAGFSPSQMQYEYGYIRLMGTQGSGWLGVKDDAVSIFNLINQGGIPHANWSANPDGTLAHFDVAHVWVQLLINGTSYAFDPSFKQHTVVAGLSNLATVLGYTQNQLLTDAGGTIDSVSISNVNRSNIRNDLAAYAANLVAYIKSNNPTWTVNDVAGGKIIQYLTGSPLRQTALPYLSPSQPSGFPQNWGAAVPNAYRTCFTISMPGVAPTSCTSPPSAQTVVLYSDQTYGHRITLFSVPSSGGNYVPTLLIDGVPPPNGQNTGTPRGFGAPWTVNVAITHPYNGANQSDGMTISAGGSYLISAGWGQVGRGMVEKHRKLLAQALAAGNAPSSELVLGESLAVIGYNWLAESAAEMRIGDQLAKITTQYHHGVGIAAQTAIQGYSNTQGPYVDLPLNQFSTTPYTHDPTGNWAPGELGGFYTLEGISSSLESAVLEQTQALVSGMQAASTIRLIDMNVAATAKTFFADGASKAGLLAYFNSIRPNIASVYTGADLNIIDYSISSTGLSTGQPTGKQVVLPANGSISVGVWKGTGYTIINQQTYSIGVSQLITGGLTGGFTGNDVPPSTVAASTQTEMLPASGNAAVSVGITAAAPAPNNPVFAEPVDAITGAYIYNHADLNTGGGRFPYALPFARTYTSSSNAIDVGLGNGWRSNYSITASRSSDPYAGLGETSPIAAAAAIAGLYVSQDLLSGTRSAQVMTVASVTNRWVTDQLTNNSVMIAWPGTNEQFTFLPHADGSASVTYNPPLGSAVVLTGTVPNIYGNYTTFTYRNKDQTQLAFSPVDTAPNGKITGWTSPNGMQLSFAYGYSYGGASYLTGVTNNLGRSLTLAYSGAHLSSVTDDTNRAVSYGYDGSNNLVTYTDPLNYLTIFAYDVSASHLTQVFYPSQPGNPFVTNIYDGLGRVAQQANANGNFSSFYFAGSRTEMIDPAGDRHVTYQTPRGKVITDAVVLSSSFGDVFNDTPQQNGVVNVASNKYDGQDRLVLATAPEGSTVGYTYSTDLEHNIIQMTRTPKPGSPLAPLSTFYSYDQIYNKPMSTTDPRGLLSTMSYDPANGNLLAIVADVGGSPHFNAKSSFTYNSFGQVLTATDPLGTITRNTYDGFGNPISITRDDGHLNQLTAMAYSPSGDVISVTDPNGNIAISAYDADRRLTSVTSPGTPAAPQGTVTAFSYDPDGRILQTQQSVGGVVLTSKSKTYTLAGDMATTTDANNNVTTYGYDAVDRLSSVTDAVGRLTSYSYDALSRRIQVLNTAIQAAPLLQRSYTPDGLFASLTDANSHTTSITYDGLDRLSVTSYSDNSTEALTYDADGNVLSRRTRANQTIQFTYDTLNRVATKAPPAAPVVTYSYDLVGRLTAANDNSTSIAAAVPPSGSVVSYTASYQYDAVNRPTSVSWSPAPTSATPTSSTVTFAHAYNHVNQRTSQSTSDSSWWLYPAATSSTVGYSTNALNQYTSIGSVTPTYDGNGNLTYDGSFTYGYDAENRLISATGSGVSASYAFDAHGRRKLKTVGTATTVFITDADNREVLDYDGTSGQIQHWYAYGLGSNDVLNQMNVPAATRATFIPDVQGSIVAALDSGSGVLTKTGYLTYGESASTSGAFRYTGQRIDPETNGLYYYRARTYAPALGRFMQPDPIGYAGGSNFYAYVNNDPLNLIDPTGEFTKQDVADYLNGSANQMDIASAFFVAQPIVPFRALGPVYAVSSFTFKSIASVLHPELEKTFVDSVSDLVAEKLPVPQPAKPLASQALSRAGETLLGLLEGVGDLPNGPNPRSNEHFGGK